MRELERPGSDAQEWWGYQVHDVQNATDGLGLGAGPVTCERTVTCERWLVLLNACRSELLQCGDRLMHRVRPAFHQPGGVRWLGRIGDFWCRQDSGR